MSKNPSQSSDVIVLNVMMTAATGREEDLARELQALLVPTRQEPGCLSYLLHVDREKPGSFMFHEVFEDQRALDEHVNSSYFQKFLKYRNQGSDPVAEVTITKWKSLG
jgi:quinol monooxygenase YgiN